MIPRQAASPLTRRTFLATVLLPVGLGVLAASCQSVSAPGGASGAANAPIASNTQAPAANTAAGTSSGLKDTVVYGTRGDPSTLNTLLDTRQFWPNIFEPL